MSISGLNSPKRLRRLSVVVPVFNNSESLPRLREELFKLADRLSPLGFDIELIFVDDGSSDNSFEVLRSLDFDFANLRLIQLVKNFGAVRASRTGVKFVSGDMFSILAADLQDPPELIFEMVKEWSAGFKFVVFERRSRKDPFLSRIFSRLHYILLRRVVFKNYPKGGVDMVLLDSSVLNTINSSVKTGSVPMLAFSLGYTPRVLKYDRPRRPFGVSGWTFTKKFNFFLDLMFGYSNKPIRLISAIGVLVSLASFTYGFLVLFSALFFEVSVPGFAALATLISFLTGIQLLMLGIVGEYLWRIYEQVNNQPLAQIQTHLIRLGGSLTDSTNCDLELE